MITIQKESVANWLLAEYMATLHMVNAKQTFFERKYEQTWPEFVAAIESAAEEDFERWDDYIEWKAQVSVAQELILKIDEVKRGNFEVA